MGLSGPNGKTQKTGIQAVKRRLRINRSRSAGKRLNQAGTAVTVSM